MKPVLTTPEDNLPIWVIYYSPKDFPGLYVLRAQYVTRAGTIEFAKEARTESSLEKIRGHLPPGLTLIGRQPQDEPQIVECWI